MNEQLSINQNIQGALGIIYQIWVALAQCDELQPGESVMIEAQGDVSVAGKFQMELKHIDPNEALTTSDLNIWNTLKNWMHDSFDPSKYRALVLRTTQDHGVRSAFKTWNDTKDVGTRLAILELIVEAAEKKLSQKPDKDKSTIPESLKLMREVMDSNKKERLQVIISKFYIETQASDLTDTYRTLLNNICRGIPFANRSKYLDALAGFIIRPDIAQGGRWEITYEEFELQREEAIAKFHLHTKRFPDKHRSLNRSPLTADQERMRDELFVKKIEQIDHLGELESAIKDYWFAHYTALDDFRKYTLPSKDYEFFLDEVENDFDRAYQIQRGLDGACSKMFYNAQMIAPAPNIPGFESTPKAFRNGVIHIHMNEPAKKHQWNLSA